MKKRYLSMVLTGLILTTLLTGCSSSYSSTSASSDSKSDKLVTLKVNLATNEFSDESLAEFTKENPPEFVVDIKGRYGEVINDIKNHILNFKIGTEKDILVCKGDIIVKPNEKINFKFKKDVKVKMFILEEVYIF